MCTSPLRAYLTSVPMPRPIIPRRTAFSGMRAPRGRGQQLDLLRSEQRTELHGKTVDEIFVREDRRPVRAPVGIVVELPQMDELIDRARVGMEVADQLLVLAAFLERGVAELGIQLDRLAHLADVQRVGPHFIDRHDDPPEWLWCRVVRA